MLFLCPINWSFMSCGAQCTARKVKDRSAQYGRSSELAICLIAVFNMMKINVNVPISNKTARICPKKWTTIVCEKLRLAVLAWVDGLRLNIANKQLYSNMRFLELHI
jgi:hypothetical protein